MKLLVVLLAVLVPLPAFGGLISEPFVGQHREDFDDGKLDAPGVTVTSGHLQGDHPWLIGSELVLFDEGGIEPGLWFAEWTLPASIYTGLAFSFAEPAAQVGVTWKGLATETSEVRARLIAPDGTTAGDYLLDVAPGKFLGFESAAGIARLEISATTRDDALIFTLDDLTYTVPEPSTLILLAIGLVALTWRGMSRG